MKKNSMWLVPAVLATLTVAWVPACSSDDEGSSGGVTPDASTDTSTTVDSSFDSSLPDASRDASEADASDASHDAAAADPYIVACARIDACALAGGPRIGMNGCYRLLTSAPFDRVLDAVDRAALESLECKLKATTCAAVRACEKPVADYTALCATAEGGDHCSGNVHVVCDDNTFAPIAAVDCAAKGEVCGGDSGFQSGCGIAPCTPGETASTCAGDILTACQGFGVTKKVDCKTANQLILVNPGGKRTIGGDTCGLTQFGTNDCIGSGGDCTGITGRCDGNVLETCSNRKLSRRDCSTVTPAGLGCGALADVPDRILGTLGCGPVNPTCKETDNETCDATTGVIGFCGLTAPKTVDCKAIGYAGCKTTTVGTRVTASCF